MSKLEELLDHLDQSRERLLMAIEPLPDEALLEANAVGRLSIADVLALLAAWEAELVTGLMQINQGKKPAKLLAALAQPEAYEAERYRENQGRDLDRIFDDFQGVRVQLEEWLEEFSERDLADPKRYPWLGGKSLARLIKDMTAGREATYTPQCDTFAREWVERHEVEPEDFIPLSTLFTEIDSDNGQEPH
jgi:hypothetical protein